MPTHPSIRDARSHVLVTGGARRLGAMICETFARAGWHVWCQYSASGAEAEALCERLRRDGHAAQAVAGDIANEAGRVALIEAISVGGPLRCIVNNASAFAPDNGTDFEPHAAMRQLEVNLIAPLSFCRLLAPSKAPTDGIDRCAIHVLDQKVFNLNPDYFSYTLSKLALERAVALQAQSMRGRVRVCGVAPGLLFHSGPQSDQNFEIAARANPLKRPIDPRDVAAACLFLAATTSLNGMSITVDNGQHLIPLERDVMFVVEEFLKQKGTP